MCSDRSTADPSQFRSPPPARSLFTHTAWSRWTALIIATLLSVCLSLHPTAVTASPQLLPHHMDPASSSSIQYPLLPTMVSNPSITQHDRDDSPSPDITADTPPDGTIAAPAPVRQRYAKTYDITIVPDPTHAGFAVKERIKLDDGESVTPTSAETPVSIQEITWLRKRVVAHLIGIEPAGDDPTLNLTLPDGSTLFVALCADGCPPTTVSVRLAPLVPRAFFAAGAVVGSPNLDNVLNEVTWSANPERLQSGVVFDTVSEPFASLRPWLDPVIGIGSGEEALWFFVVATLIIIGGALTKLLPNLLATSLSARVRQLASGLRWLWPRRDESPSISAPSSAMESPPVATSSAHPSSDRR